MRVASTMQSRCIIAASLKVHPLGCENTRTAEYGLKECQFYWFADGDNKVIGADAVKFFERSGLPREQLAKVQKIAHKAFASIVHDRRSLKSSIAGVVIGR